MSMSPPEAALALPYESTTSTCPGGTDSNASHCRVLPLRYGSRVSTSSRMGMNRMVNASPTNPSTTSLSGRTPSSCGCRNPRLYSCVAMVDVLTCRNVSSTPSGSGASSSVMAPPDPGCAVSDDRTAGHLLLAVPGVPLLLHLVQHPHCGQHRPAGDVRLTARVDGLDEVRRDQLGVLLLGRDGLLAVAGGQRRAALVGAVAVAVGHHEGVVDVLARVVRAGRHDRLVVVGLDGEDQLHGDAGALVEGRVTGRDGLDPLLHGGEVAPRQHPQPEVHEVGGVVPQKVVGPTALQPGRTDVLQAVDEEATLHAADPLP